MTGLWSCFSSFLVNLICKISPLVLGEILGVFVNTLTAKGMYPVQDSENFPLPIQMQLSEKWKTFSHFLFHFLNLQNTLNILKGKIIVIANVFPKLEIVKKFVRTLSKKRRFRKRFESQLVKASQILAKSQWEHFSHVFSSLWGNLIWKMSPLVLGEILGVFVNKLTAEGKSPLDNWQNLPLPIRIQLSEKRKTFPQFFVPFLEFTLNFKHFE